MINDPVDNIIQTFDNHPSIRRIRDHISQIELFSFNNVNDTQMETEINELNPNKSSGMDDIPINILKESMDIVKSPLTQLFNTYMWKINSFQISYNMTL